MSLHISAACPIINVLWRNSVTQRLKIREKRIFPPYRNQLIIFRFEKKSVKQYDIMNSGSSASQLPHDIDELFITRSSPKAIIIHSFLISHYRFYTLFSTFPASPSSVMQQHWKRKATTRKTVTMSASAKDDLSLTPAANNELVSTRYDVLMRLLFCIRIERWRKTSIDE